MKEFDTNIIANAAARIAPFIHRTPVLTSELVNDMAGCDLFFKCENFQKMGAFKMRGASNAILNLTEEEKAKGVVTHSSGNFAQAVALASRLVGITANIVMPTSAPQVKKNAVMAYDGIITECAPTIEARESTAALIKEQTGATLLHPSNDLDVIIGQGTSAYELLQDHPDLDHIIVPIGGGGLIAGTALAAEFHSENCTVIGAEPKEVDDAYRSLITGKIERNETINTIADGLMSGLGNNNFPIIQKHIKKIILVEEIEIIDAMKFVWERMKIIIEPSSAVAFAAVLKDKEFFENKKVGLIVSGGNVDLMKLPF